MQEENVGESAKIMHSLQLKKEQGKRTENDTQVDEEDVVISSMPQLHMSTLSKLQANIQEKEKFNTFGMLPFNF